MEESRIFQIYPNLYTKTTKFSLSSLLFLLHIWSLVSTSLLSALCSLLTAHIEMSSYHHWFQFYIWIFFHNFVYHFIIFLVSKLNQTFSKLRPLVFLAFAFHGYRFILNLFWKESRMFTIYSNYLAKTSQSNHNKLLYLLSIHISTLCLPLT